MIYINIYSSFELFLLLLFTLVDTYVNILGQNQDHLTGFARHDS